MKIAGTKWKAYTASLARICNTAAQKMIQYAEKNGLDDRKGLIDYAMALTQKYSEGTAELACEMYDTVARMQGANVPDAEPADTPDYGEVAKSVNGTLKQSPEGKLIGDSVGRLVKRAGADTMLKNAKRDRAEFAWIPSGDSCAFCQMIASRGWQPATSKTVQGDHAEHIHANCECEFAIRFSKDLDVAGYEPEKLREQYDSAEGSTPKEKVNSMRRENYNKKTGRMSTEEYARAVEEWDKVKEIDLPAQEREHIFEEFDNNLTAEEKGSSLVMRPIGDYYYYAVNKGHNEYKIYKKEPIEQVENVVNEVLAEMFGKDWEEQWKETQK